VGAGTTLLAAKEMGIPGNGYDLSPLAVLVSNTKTATFSRKRLEAAWQSLERTLICNSATPLNRTYPELVQKALPEGRLEALDTVATSIENLKYSSSERDFFRLALLSIIPHFSQAVATGGWLRWLNQGAGAEKVTIFLKKQVEMMLSDICDIAPQVKRYWKARVADARVMPASDEKYSAVITSPPYPNRHDYTRIFGVELMFAFLDWEANRALRYQTFHSHPEARPNRPAAERYKSPKALSDSIRDLSDKRMQHMLEGYFLDMYLCLCEVARVCRKGAKAAFVVGNAQYDGKAILVDEFTAEVGEQAGLICEEIRVVRRRGNSAQQMGKYGRMASRESVVMFEKP
jgi:site-specific DNA-methyltransferase (cytosine-N4-specific)